MTKNLAFSEYKRQRKLKEQFEYAVGSHVTWIGNSSHWLIRGSKYEIEETHYSAGNNNELYVKVRHHKEDGFWNCVCFKPDATYVPNILDEDLFTI